MFSLRARPLSQLPHTLSQCTAHLRTPAPLPTLLSILRGRTQERNLHASRPTPPIPSPTKRVPDVPRFLSQIGRAMDKHAARIGTWETLFGATSAQLRALGVEPARDRRYLLRWRELFRAYDGQVKLYEDRRGRKIDGGERRRKEVRAKRFAEERRAAEGIDR